MTSWMTLMAVGQQSGESALALLDEPRRAAVLMALVGLVLLGIAMVACVMIGARWVRKQAAHGHGRTELPSRQRDTSLRDILPCDPDTPSEETVYIDSTSTDTRAD